MIVKYWLTDYQVRVYFTDLLRWGMILLNPKTWTEECRDLNQIHTLYTGEISLDMYTIIIELNIDIMVSLTVHVYAMDQWNHHDNQQFQHHRAPVSVILSLGRWKDIKTYYNFRPLYINNYNRIFIHFPRFLNIFLRYN